MIKKEHTHNLVHIDKAYFLVLDIYITSETTYLNTQQVVQQYRQYGVYSLITHPEWKYRINL